MIVVDRDYRADMLHGRTPIGEIVATIAEGDDALPLMAQGVARRRRASAGSGLLFLDLETTGSPAAPARRHFSSAARRSTATRSASASSCCRASSTNARCSSELAGLGASTRRALTYNGRTFDVPLIETRFMFHRLPCPLGRRAASRHAARRRGGCGGSGR